MIEEYNFSKKFSDKLMYLFAFLGGLLLLILGSVIFIIPLLVNSNALTLNISQEELTNTIYTYAGFLSVASAILGIGAYTIFFSKTFSEDLVKFKKKIWRNLIIIAIAIVTIFLLSYFFEWLYNKLSMTPDSENEKAVNLGMTGNGKWMMIIDVVIFAPIFEELVFRKCLFGFFRRTKLPIVLSLFLTAFVFAIIHCTTENFLSLEAYIYLSNYMALSLMLCLAYYYARESIYTSIIIHMINNLISVLAFFGVFNVII